MRGKKYKAKDKKVQKSGRSGLSEINLHSHESVNISSREKENTIRKAPDSVNYQKARRRGRSTEHENKKRHRRAAVPENKSCAGCNDESGRDGNFQQPEAAGGKQDNMHQPEMSGNRQAFQAYGMDGFRTCSPEPERLLTETDPGAAGEQAQAAETPGICSAAYIKAGVPGNGTPAGGICHKGPESLAGMAARSRERQQHGSVVRHELKYDALHLSPGLDGSTSMQKDEKMSCGQENEADSGMDVETLDSRLFHERGHISVQPCRCGSRQQPLLRPAGMGNGRRQPGRKQEKRRRRKKKIYQESGQYIFPGESCSGVSGKEENAESGTFASSDTDSYSGMSDRRNKGFGSTAADESWQADSVGQTLQEKKQRLFFSSDEKTGSEVYENDDLKDASSRKAAGLADTGTGRAGSRNPQKAFGTGDFKSASSQKGANAERTVPPDGPENSSQKHGQPETAGKKNRSRLIFGEKDSGMVCGTGMGIAKHTARHVFHAVDESGSVGTDALDESGTGPEKMQRSQRAGAAASGLRYMICSRSSRMAKRRQRLDESSRSRQPETAEKASGTGYGPQPGTGSRSGRNPESAAWEKKKSIRSRQQKKRYKRIYQSEARAAIRKAGWKAAGAEKTGISGNTPFTAGRRRYTVFTFGGRRKNMQWLLAAVFLFFLAGVSMLTSCAALFQGASGIAGTTYPGSDEDIRSTETRYLELENALDSQVNSMEAAHPGYDEYRYQIDEISHDPYKLASYLTVICPGYTYEQAEGMLQEILESQYRLTVEEQTETRTDPDTGETVEWRVLCILLTNRGLDAVANERLTEEQEKLYQAYNLTHGCRDGLFGETEENGGPDAGNPDAGVPAVPGGALSDQRFANMLREAEKYLGYPYVWGGSSPQTSFDCSGFVSWVVNNCGNGWNVGRRTAEGLRGCCVYVTPEDARPGDLIFFQGTYNTPGASHVGIYVGNNRMIHCGSPIQYAELGNYWNLHFLSYGRLP